MVPELKQFYLMQSAHWLHELMIMVLGFEKPRKDFAELVAHHIVTLWLVGCVHHYDRDARRGLTSI